MYCIVFKFQCTFSKQLGLPVVLSIPDFGAPDTAPHSQNPSGEHTISDKQPVEEGPKKSREGETVNGKNKFSTLLGWSRKDNLPPLDEQ